MNGQIATNLVQTSALAEIANSTVEATAGRVDVSAEQAAVMSADSVSATDSGADAIGITLAFNTIGWEASNLLFNLVETIVSDPLIAEALDGENPSSATARIVASDVTAGTDVKVDATSNELMNATVSNAVTSAAGAIVNAGGKSIALVLANNKVSGEATAFIDNADAAAGADIQAGGSVDVIAKDTARLLSNTSMKSESTVSNTGGADVLQETLNDLETVNWIATNTAQLAELDYGQKVRLADDYGDNAGASGTGGSVYVYLGEPAVGVDLSTTAFDNLDSWKLDPVSSVIPQGFNVTDSDSYGVGGIIITNDLRAETKAYISHAFVVAQDGDITVQSIEDALMNAVVDASVISSGGSAIGGGDSIAVNGIIATNTLNGGARAYTDTANLSALDDTSGLGNILVDAQNTAQMTATNNAITTSGDTAVGIILAYNSVGYQATNLLFATVDALLGDASILGDPDAVEAEAYMRNTTANAAGEVAVLGNQRR